MALQSGLSFVIKEEEKEEEGEGEVREEEDHHHQTSIPKGMQAVAQTECKSEPKTEKV